MNEKGREMWLAFVTILIAGILAAFGIITGDQWIQLASWYAGGTTAGRILYKLIRNGNGTPKPVIKPDAK